MKHKLRLTISNPLLLVFPIIIVLLAGWQHYTHAGLALSISASNNNLMANGNFETFNSDGVPDGWKLDKSGNSEYTTVRSNGYVDGNSLNINVSHYNSGAVTLTSPKVDLRANQTYLFKGYFTSSTNFALLARYYYKDGTNQLVFLKEYPSNTGTWSTVSDAFMTSKNIVGVQYVYQISSDGSLTVNGVYLEPRQNIYISSIHESSHNEIPNSSLNVDRYFNIPVDWSTYSDGTNTSLFSYNNTGTDPNVQVAVGNYANGEAKWQYVPQPVSAHQYYDFSVSYKSDALSQLVVEYVTKNNARQFVTLGTLTPSNDWTSLHNEFEVPPGAVNMFVTAVLQSNGNLATRDYSLVNVTKPGAGSWKRPIVSITFDDGWKTDYTNAFKILNGNGYKATFYINPSSIETQHFMTAGDLKSLYANGNEIAAHGFAHDDMTTINDHELDYQLRYGRDYLREAGFKVDDFATPYGNGDAVVQWYARKYFQTLRGTETGINTRQSFEPYNLKVLYIENTTKVQEIIDALKNAGLYNGWLILVYHNIGDTNPPNKSLKVENNTISASDFVKQVSLIKESNITVLPVGKAYTEVQHQL